MSMKLKAEV